MTAFLEGQRDTGFKKVNVYDTQDAARSSHQAGKKLAEKKSVLDTWSILCQQFGWENKINGFFWNEFSRPRMHKSL